MRLEQQPDLVGEEEWQKEMREALQALDGAGAALATVPPPSEEIPKPALYSWRRAQKHLERVGSETQALATEWQEAVDAGDAGAVQRAAGAPAPDRGRPTEGVSGDRPRRRRRPPAA